MVGKEEREKGSETKRRERDKGRERERERLQKPTFLELEYENTVKGTNPVKNGNKRL